jgi:carbonic anhydrase/acetyltransferase-like protein (isoleucine patch superfamily)
MLITHEGRCPQIAADVFVEESARVIGEVTIGRLSSVWFNVVIRGDVNFIRIGERTNIQDCSVVHVTHETHPTHIGDDVTVGHNVTLHGCTVRDRCLIGMGSLILDGAVISDDVMVAAGSLVTPGTVIPPRTLAMGSPAKPRRDLTEEEVAHLRQSAQNYVQYAKSYKNKLI